MTRIAFALKAVIVLLSMAAATAVAELRADEKPSVTTPTAPCASMAVVVYPGMGPQDLKDIQAVIDKFMARVRAKCLADEGV